MFLAVLMQSLGGQYVSRDWMVSVRCNLQIASAAYLTFVRILPLREDTSQPLPLPPPPTFEVIQIPQNPVQDNPNGFLYK